MPLPTPLAAARGSETPAELCPVVLLDGMLIQKGALSMGLSTMLFPGQALLVEEPDGARVAFSHGVPQQTQLSMASFVQDKRIRRALLEQHRIPVPKGATFSVGRGRRAALEYADRLGYPLTVKPMVGDSTVENFTRVTGPEGLQEVFEYFRTAAPYRERYEAASYAFTAIHMPKEDTRQTKDSYRLLLEQKVFGQYMRFLVVDGELLSAVHLPDGLDDVSAAREVLRETHWTVRDFATYVSSVFAGLKLVVIDVVLGEGFDTPMGDQAGHVVEVAERPWLYPQNMVSTDWATDLALCILSAGRGGDFDPQDDPSESITVTAEWQGVTQAETFEQQLIAAAQSLGIDCRMTETDPIGGIVRGSMAGTPGAISLLNELSVAGYFVGERIMAVQCASAESTSRV